MKRPLIALLLSGWLLSPTLYATDRPAPKRQRPPNDDSRLFLKVYGYYGLVAPGSYRLTSNVSSFGSGTSNKNAFEQSQGIGVGLRAGLGLGYIVSDIINLGLDAEYCLPASIEAPGSFTSSGVSGSSVGQSTQTFTYEFVTLTPNITLKAITKADYYIYSRVGLSVVLPLTFQRGYTSTSATTTGTKTTQTAFDYQYDYKGKIDLGFQSALGVQFSAGTKIRVFGEVVFNAYTFNPSGSTYTSISSSATSPTTTSTLEYIYQKSGEYVSTPGAKTVTVQQERFQANSLGVAVGLAYRF
ncbi:MAG: hypothetical protein LH606_20440 [Cytophagaceae bacterium]|nr:hypothetical protein [Cytophagaceae bacterium]